MTLAFDDDILWLFVAENMPPLWNNICRSVVSVRSRNATFVCMALSIPWPQRYVDIIAFYILFMFWVFN